MFIKSGNTYFDPDKIVYFVRGDEGLTIYFTGGVTMELDESFAREVFESLVAAWPSEVG